MGYTHSWHAPRNYTAKDWALIVADVTSILNEVQHVAGIPLANGMGDRGTSPEINDKWIGFNGVGADAHESVHIRRTRLKDEWGGRTGSDFCKTDRKPYDLAVTAVLAYLGSVEHGGKVWSVGTDGSGRDWLAGVALARKAVPQYANVIDIPLGVRQDDRWNYRARYDIGISNVKSDKYDLVPCIDGHVYVFSVKDESKAYRFESYAEAKEYLSKFKEPRIYVAGGFGLNGYEGGQPIFATSGSYDKKRHDKLKRDHNRILKQLVDAAPILGRDIPPPAFARPNEMLAPEAVEDHMTPRDRLFNLVNV
jgi:hypothetical protein